MEPPSSQTTNPVQTPSGQGVDQVALPRPPKREALHWASGCPQIKECSQRSWGIWSLCSVSLGAGAESAPGKPLMGALDRVLSMSNQFPFDGTVHEVPEPPAGQTEAQDPGQEGPVRPMDMLLASLCTSEAASGAGVCGGPSEGVGRVWGGGALHTPCF